MTDKQMQILVALARCGDRGMTPTKIGEACGKHYDVASSWACSGLKGLIKGGLVEPADIAGTKERRYRLTEEGKKMEATR